MQTVEPNNCRQQAIWIMPRFSSGLACTHLRSGVLLMHNVLPEAILYFETRRAHCTCIKYSKPCIGTHQRNLHLHGCGTDETDVHLTCQATLEVWKYNIAFLPVKGYRNVGNGTASSNKDSSGISTLKRGWEYWTCLLLSIEETEVTQLKSTNICTESTWWMLHKFYLAIRLRGWRGEAKHCSWLKEVAMDRLGKCFFETENHCMELSASGCGGCRNGELFQRKIWPMEAVSHLWSNLSRMAHRQPGDDDEYNSWLIWGIQCKLGKMTVYCQSDDTKLDRIQYPCTIRSRLCVNSIRR